jgi:hypothetical protein
MDFIDVIRPRIERFFRQIGEGVAAFQIAVDLQQQSVAVVLFFRIFAQSLQSVEVFADGIRPGIAGSARDLPFFPVPSVTLAPRGERG